MSTYADRLKALREQLKANSLDGFVVPLTDEHMSEYVGSYAQRLAWLTGFEGSAGSAIGAGMPGTLFNVFTTPFALSLSKGCLSLCRR